MKAIVSAKNAKLFQPFYPAIIAGKQAQVSLKDFQENPRKFINTGISFLYDNEAELRKWLKSNKPKVTAEVLDMSKAKRGKTFSNPEEASAEIKSIIAKQTQRRARLADKFKKNQAAAKKKADSSPKKSGTKVVKP